jgi:molybdenum cofactor biosynthesis enzyme MoaA
MHQLVSRQVKIGPFEAEYVGSSLAKDRAFFFFRKDGCDLVFEASPCSSARADSLKGKILEISCSFFPVHDPTNDPLVAAIAERLLHRETNINSQIQAALTRDGRPPNNRNTNDPNAIAIFPITGTVEGLLVLGTRGQYPIKLAKWSARLQNAQGADPAAVQSLLLALAAHLLADGGFLAPEMAPAYGTDRPEKYDIPGHTERRKRPVTPMPLPGGHVVNLGLDLAQPNGLAEAVRLTKVGHADVLTVRLDLNTHCMQKCVYCAGGQKSTVEPGDTDLIELERLAPDLEPMFAKAHAVMVVLAGNDALNAPRLTDIMARLEAMRRFDPIRFSVFSPGTRLADRNFVESLRPHGLQWVCMTLLGGSADENDRLTGRPGAFAELLLSLENLERAEIGVELSVVLVEENVRSLGQMLETARDLDLSVTINAFFEDGRLPDQCRPLYAKYSLICAVLEKNREIVSANVRSLRYMPFCTVPDWAMSLLPTDAPTISSLEFVATCEKCSFRNNGCPGIGKSYLALHGSDEFRARRTAGPEENA